MRFFKFNSIDSVVYIIHCVMRIKQDMALVSYFIEYNLPPSPTKKSQT